MPFDVVDYLVLMARTLLITALLVLAVALLLILPVRVSHSISVPGKVYPAQEWTLLRDASGALGAVLRDHSRGTVESYSVSQFVRGDAVRVTFDQALVPAAEIAAGDTIASIYSNETERQISELSGDLASMISMLDVYSSGEKESIVQQAQAQVHRARELVQQQQITVDRLRILRSNDHASEQELHLAETQLGVYKSELEIALAELATVQSGAKPEQLNLTRTQADALRNEIASLQDRLNMYTLTSPISGMTVRSFGPDTLLTIKSNTQYVVVMPVPWSRYEIVERGQAVEVVMPKSRETALSTVSQFGDAVHTVNGQPVVMATAFVSDDSHNLIPGAIVSCSIRTGKVSLLEYVRRVLS